MTKSKAKKPKVVGTLSVDVTLLPPRRYLAFTEEVARLLGPRAGWT